MGIKLHSMEETDLNEKRRSIIAKIVVVLEIICSVAIMVIVHESKLIPAKYEIAMCAVLILILIAVTYFTMLGKNKILYWIFLVLSVLISIVMVLAGIGISQTKNTIEEITKSQKIQQRFRYMSMTRIRHRQFRMLRNTHLVFWRLWIQRIRRRQ